MFVRNFLTAGDYVTIVPLGLPVTLQYSANGILEKILRGHGDDTVDITDKLKDLLLLNKKVPRSVSIKNGTTWVSGVFYTSMHNRKTGRVSEDTSEGYIQLLESNVDQFEFYAGSVNSMSTSFRGAVPIRQWLSLSGFEVLPGYVIPSDLDENRFEHMVTSSRYPFKWPLIQSYIIFHRNSISYHTLSFRWERVLTSYNCVKDDGSVITEAGCTGDINLELAYSDALKMNVQPNVYVLIDESSRVIYSDDVDCLHKPLMDNTKGKLKCPVCGKLYQVPSSGPVRCPDEHCNSRLFTRTNQLLATLNLPCLSREEYDELTHKIGPLYSYPDVLDNLPHDHEVELTFSQLLRACVPEHIVKGPDGFTSFCSKCNNDKDTILYYLNNPDRAFDDLNLVESSVNYVKFIHWLEDPENVADIKSVMMHDNISIVGQFKALQNVAPIFRGVTILITGRFVHGNESRIFAILSSYGATVVTRFDDKVSMVVVGDTRDGVNGQYLRQARNRNIPIYDESSFFKRYEIDNDLQENL